jgi:hypothetical protein
MEAQTVKSNLASKGIPKATGPRNAEAMVKEGYKRYGIEKGIVHFELEGAVTGTEILYFEQWGWREARYIQTTTEAGSILENTNTVQFLDGESRYEYFPEKKQAALFESPQVQQAALRYKTRDMVKVGIEMMKNMGGVRKGLGLVIGEQCEIWELSRYKTTVYMWKGLTLKEESMAAGVPVKRFAVKITKRVDPPDGKLFIPKNTRLIRN